MITHFGIFFSQKVSSIKRSFLIPIDNFHMKERLICNGNVMVMFDNEDRKVYS